MSVVRETFLAAVETAVRAAVTNTGILSDSEIVAMFNATLGAMNTTDPGKKVTIRQAMTGATGGGLYTT